MTRTERRRLTQLTVCATAFVLLVGVKLLLPGRLDAVGDALSQAMSRNMDVARVFSAVGRAVSGKDTVGDALDDVYQAVFRPTEAVRTAAPTVDGASAALAPLRAYADGDGDAFAWLPPAGDAGAAAELILPPAADADSAAAAAGGSGGAVPASGTGEVSYVLYDRENLPENVSMEQAVLGFDYTTPVKGALTSGFGYREHPLEGEERFHYGLDIAADSGTAVGCFADGQVTAVGESSSYGKYCVVSHGNGWSTLYAHCSKITAASGTAVEEGGKIAEVGETGMATGPHLHFELIQNGTYLNPIYYVALS